LCNRRVLEAIYSQFIEEQDETEALSFIIMDIDKFKTFNDTHGHPVGDQVLKFVAQLLKKECPDSIIPVRFGGEEFAMLCPNCDIEKANVVAENIRKKLSEMAFKHQKTGDRLPSVTASFGLAQRHGSEILTQMIERADKALYVAKDEGRNQVKRAS
jgi:diguanylate cyclase